MRALPQPLTHPLRGRRALARPTRLLATGLVVSAAALLLDGAAADVTHPKGAVFHLRLDSIIQSVTEDFLAEAVAEADASDAALVVIELNTPGGLADSTRGMTSAMLEADTPVAVFVSPPGSQAASAGFFLLMASDIAAMAPGTNTGAAHPVGGQGQDIPGTMGEKVEQDSAATIRSLASEHGRNEELAEAAVVESRSYSAKEALEEGLVEVLADNLDDLLDQLDGRTITKAGKEITLDLADAPRVTIEMTTFQRIRSVLVNPNVAFLLLSLGGLGLYFELSTPGAIFPGVFGAICLLLGLYGAYNLPVNYIGVALLILAVIFFILEIKVTSFGLLTAAGIISLVLGALLLFDSPDPAIRVSLQLVGAMALFAGVVVAFLMTLVVRAYRRQPATGQEGLVHERGVARTALAPRGKVSVHGEIWNAESTAPVEPGTEIEIVAVDGMTLKVQPIHA